MMALSYIIPEVFRIEFADVAEVTRRRFRLLRFVVRVIWRKLLVPPVEIGLGVFARDVGDLPIANHFDEIPKRPVLRGVPELLLGR